MLGTENDVLKNREWLDQHEVLVEHTDSVPEGIFGSVNTNGFAVYNYVAGIGLIVAVDDAHQG